MARPTPPVPPMELKARTDHGMIVEKRSYELITPLFGGGVEPNTPDPVTTIRATEIRGHLRFWWRATRGGQFATIEELKAKEDEIWGAAAKFDKEGKIIAGPSVNLKVEMKDIKKLEYIPTYQICTDKNNEFVANYVAKEYAPEYFCFSLKPSKETIQNMGCDTPIHNLVGNVKFKLELTLKNEFFEDVNAALWAWETFGGVGARTRRGFGAVKRMCDDMALPPSSFSEFSEWIKEKCNMYIIDSSAMEDLPNLSKKLNFRIIPANKSVMNIWNSLSSKLKLFRSRTDDIPFRKNDIKAIRTIFDGGNKRLIDVSHFQRAYLGLPVAYQNLKKVYRSGVKVEKATLQGKRKQHQRLASPVILRPIACQDGKYLGIALLLVGTKLPDELTLDDNDLSIPTKLNKELNVLDAFMNFVRSKNND